MSWNIVSFFSRRLDKSAVVAKDRVKHPGSQGGIGYYDEHGHWQYGERPHHKGATTPPAEPQHLFRNEHQLPLVARQPWQDEESLYAHAKTAQQGLHALLAGHHGVASALGMRVFEPGKKPSPEDYQRPGGFIMLARLKGRERAEQKVTADDKGDWSRLLDVVRATIAVDDMPHLWAVVNELRRRGVAVARSPKNRFLVPTDAGYRDALLNLKLDGGMVVEVQLHLKPVLLAKQEAHKQYEVIRDVDAAEKAGTATEEDRKRRAEAMAQSRKIYGEAWARANPGGVAKSDWGLLGSWLRGEDIVKARQGHDVSGEPRDARGRWTNAEDWVSDPDYPLRKWRKTDNPKLSMSQKAGVNDEKYYNEAGKLAVRKVPFLEREFIVHPKGVPNHWDDKHYSWRMGSGYLSVPNGADIRVKDDAEAEALAEELANIHVTQGAKAVQERIKAKRAEIEARRKQRADDFLNNPRVGDKINERPAYMGMSDRMLEVVGFEHNGKETRLTIKDGASQYTMPLTEWRKTARVARNIPHYAPEGRQTFQGFEESRLGADVAAKQRQDQEDRKKRKAAALKARETYRRNRAQEWVTWAQKGVTGPISGKFRTLRGEVNGRDTFTPGVTRLGNFDENGIPIDRVRAFGSNASLDGFESVMPRPARRKGEKDREPWAYKVRYDRQNNGEYVVRDNYGTYVGYVPSFTDAEKLAYMLGRTAKQGEAYLEQAQATIGGMTPAERQRQMTRDWDTGRYTEYMGCEACGKGVGWDDYSSFDYVDTIQEVDGKEYDFGGRGLTLCSSCIAKLNKMSIPDAYAVLTGEKRIPTGRASRKTTKVEEVTPEPTPEVTPEPVSEPAPEPVEDAKLVEPALLLLEQPVKRGRGRPKGSKNKPKTDAPMVEAPVVSAVKRGRGRPPGSKNKPKEAVTVATSAPVASEVKRGRGRPKGSKNKPKVPALE